MSLKIDMDKVGYKQGEENAEDDSNIINLVNRAAITTVQPAAAQPRVKLTLADEIKPEAIAWIWRGWLAAGKLHILAGAPGCGKTTIAMALAATVSCGGRWPDGTNATAGSVLIWSGEDDPADTLVPRILLSGGNLKRIYFLSGVEESSGEQRPFDPGKDIELLRQQVAEIGDVRLVIVDPIVSAVTGDSHKNAEVRRSLQPLVELAASCGAAVLGISHFAKGTAGRDPTERVVGSMAFGALARIVLAAAKVKGDDGNERRILCRSKSNIGQDDGGYEYALMPGEPIPGVTTTTIAWGKPIAGAARELLVEPDDGKSATRGNNEVQRFVRGALLKGSKYANEVIAEGESIGFSKRAIQRAAYTLGVVRRKDGMLGGWMWRLPLPGETGMDADAEDDTEDAKPIDNGTFGTFGAFGENLASSATTPPPLISAEQMEQMAAGQPRTLTAGPLTVSERERIRRWLSSIGETSPEEISKVLTQAEINPTARKYYLEQAHKLH